MLHDERSRLSDSRENQKVTCGKFVGLGLVKPLSGLTVSRMRSASPVAFLTASVDLCWKVSPTFHSGHYKVEGYLVAISELL